MVHANNHVYVSSDKLGLRVLLHSIAKFIPYPETKIMLNMLSN